MVIDPRISINGTLQGVHPMPSYGRPVCGTSQAHHPETEDPGTPGTPCAGVDCYLRISQDVWINCNDLIAAPLESWLGLEMIGVAIPPWPNFPGGWTMIFVWLFDTIYIHLFSERVFLSHFFDWCDGRESWAVSPSSHDKWQGAASCHGRHGPVAHPSFWHLQWIQTFIATQLNIFYIIYNSTNYINKRSIITGWILLRKINYIDGWMDGWIDR